MIDKILFPRNYKCVICGKEIVKGKLEFCNDCYSELPFIEGKQCIKCGEPIKSQSEYCIFCKKNMPLFTRSYSVFEYDKPISSAIYNLKYLGEKYLAESLSYAMLQYIHKNNLQFDFIIPVPLHEKRLKERGFNQAELLCYAFKEYYDVRTDVISRVKHTISQTTLSKEERAQNVNDAFRIDDKKAVKDATILLVDDVYTTGSTFNSMTKELLKHGAKNVYGLTLSHTCLEKSLLS